MNLSRGNAELMAQPNWVTNPNAETRLGCGPCQVDKTWIAPPMHFWGSMPTQQDVDYAQQQALVGGQTMSQRQNCWCMEECSKYGCRDSGCRQ